MDVDVLKKLQGRARKVRIGKSLPEDERFVVDIHPVSSEDLLTSREMGKTDEVGASVWLIQRILRCTDKEAQQVAVEFYEEIIEAASNIDEGKMERIEKMLHKRG